MGCSSCSTGKDGKPGGCKSNGGCSTGGCNRLNTYDWLSKLDIHDVDAFSIVEVSFSHGARKGFYHNPPQGNMTTGDVVLVETDAGYDIGHISLSGELVRMQMRKKRVNKNSVLKKVIRRANERDLERLDEARSVEKHTMVRARAIARTLDLDMKIGDVEFQADKRKATFYYTADGRVDFRELIRHFAKEFKVKVEMRQIGARQESARIGGIGSCGRELCCSTWLSDFKTVSTAAARYQNLAINQSKLSGQCGRLKCCLNFELDTYIDALEVFPKKADKLFTEAGTAVLVKTDIFKQIMYYCYLQENGIRGKFYPLHVSRVKEIQEMNKNREKPMELMDSAAIEAAALAAMPENDYESVNDVIELPPEERRKRRNKRKKRGGSSMSGGNRSNKPNANNKRSDGASPQKNDHKSDQKRKPNNRSNKPKTDNKPQSSNGNENQKQTGNNKRSNRPNRSNNRKGANPNQKSNKPTGNKGGNNHSNNQQSPKPVENKTGNSNPNSNNATDNKGDAPKPKRNNRRRPNRNRNRNNRNNKPPQGNDNKGGGDKKE